MGDQFDSGTRRAAEVFAAVLLVGSAFLALALTALFVWGFIEVVQWLVSK